MQPINLGRPSAATARALERVRAGERPTHAARAEGIHSSTIFRALAMARPPKHYLIVGIEQGSFEVWVEDQAGRKIGARRQYATIGDLQAALPAYFTFPAPVHAPSQ